MPHLGRSIKGETRLLSNTPAIGGGVNGQRAGQSGEIFDFPLLPFPFLFLPFGFLFRLFLRVWKPRGAVSKDAINLKIRYFLPSPSPDQRYFGESREKNFARPSPTRLSTEL